MKHVLTIQDLSCIGECSLKAALPLLSVMGHETSVLPVSILSSHTAFEHVSVQSLSSSQDIVDAWKAEGILFDCILCGYLNSPEQTTLVEEIVDHFLKEDGLFVYDPAMADHGKLYRGLSLEMVEKVKTLAKRADILLPNGTEACLLCDQEADEELDEKALEKLCVQCSDLYDAQCVITGLPGEKETGILAIENHHLYAYHHPRLKGSYFGTGDLFAAVFTGYYLNHKSVLLAASKACDFVSRSIECTDQDHWYGVQFEKILYQLAEKE